MRECFTAQQSATVKLEGTLEQVQRFIQDPGNLMSALLRTDQFRRLDTNRFEVRMQPIGALGIQIRPIVKLQLITTAAAEVQLKAIGCRVEGNEWIDRNFDLEFFGELAPLQRRAAMSTSGVTLIGKASLKVWIGLPPMLRFTPSVLIQSIGTTITRGVLLAIQSSLTRRLPIRFQSSLRSGLLD